MKGIIIKKTPLDLILGGNKTWEIRGSPATHRGFVGLVESGRQKVVGFAKLVDCIKLDNEVFASHSDRHGSPALHSGYKTPYAWVLESPVRLQRALPYQHKQGCVIWVNIDDSVVAYAMLQAYVDSKAGPRPPEEVAVVARAPEPRPLPPQPRPGNGGDHLTVLEHLEKHGYAVVPTDLDVAQARAYFDAEIANFPEFNADASKYVLGGFGALGNPASFHNPTVRLLRVWAHAIIRPLLAPLAGTRGGPMYFEQVVDRMMVRQKGESASAEAWHRDEAKLAGADDLVFGGWWNLDSTAQYFSCIAGSHKVVSGNKGFATVKLSAELKAQMRRDRTKVEIPPGHILVFYEKILHEIEATKRRTDMYRQFLGWRMSPTGEPLVANLRELLATQAVVPLKSGQMPPMYAKLHWTNHRDLLERFSANVRPECKTVRTVGSGVCKGERRCVVDMVMGSLESYQFRKYEAYSEREIALLLPDVI